MLPPELVAKLNECATTNFIGVRDMWLFKQSLFSWVVIGGLVLESPELIYDVLSIARSNIRRFRYSIVLLENRVELAKLAAFVGWIFIIIGLLGELRAGSKIANLNASIQGCSDAKVREATLEAGDAAISARTARDEARAVHDEARALKTEANDIAGRLKTASGQLGKLEHQLDIQGPRWRILEDRNKELIAALKPFAGQKLTVVRCGPKPAIEEYRLANDIVAFLGGPNGAGWITAGDVWTDCPTMFSNSVMTHAPGNSVLEAEKALIDVLNNRLGIATSDFPDFSVREWEATKMGAVMLGPGSPLNLVLRDSTRMVLLIGPNPMVDVPQTVQQVTSGKKQSVKKR